MGALTRCELLLCEGRILGKHVDSDSENMRDLLHKRVQKHNNELGEGGAASHVRKVYSSFLTRWKQEEFAYFVIRTIWIFLDMYQMMYIILISHPKNQHLI